MSSAPDSQLRRAFTALRAFEPPSNGFEARLRGSLLQVAADPPAPGRDRRGPDVRDREQPEPRESEGRGRR